MLAYVGHPFHPGLEEAVVDVVDVVDVDVVALELHRLRIPIPIRPGNWWTGDG